MTTPGNTPLNPHLPDLDFTDQNWSMDFDDPNDTEPDDDDVPGLAVTLVFLLGQAVIAAAALFLLAVVLAVIVPFVA